MKIISCYVKELKRYSVDDLRRIFKLTEEEVPGFISILKKYKILKVADNAENEADLSEIASPDNIATIDDPDNFLVFNYVGVVACGRRILIIYPKYLPDNIEPLKEMKQVLRVISKYNNNKAQIIDTCLDIGNNPRTNIWGIILTLLDDYFENGLYSNEERIVELNGGGTLYWDKIINETLPLIHKNKPYYTELYTFKTIDDEIDYFRILHKAVLTDACRYLSSSHLDKLFDITPVDFGEEEIEYCGGQEYILQRVSAELNIQFNTRKQNLLKMLYSYISMDKDLINGEEALRMYGTTSFNKVWENVCATVFKSQLNAPISKVFRNIPQSIETSSLTNTEQTLLNIFDKPIWKNANNLQITAEGSLIPDAVALYSDSDTTYFYILDAKYYVTKAENNKLKYNPGVNDISKQFLYSLSFKPFCEANGFIVKNCFLMPTSEENSRCVWKISMGNMQRLMDVDDVQVYLLPTAKMYDAYLKGENMSISFLEGV